MSFSSSSCTHGATKEKGKNTDFWDGNAELLPVIKEAIMRDIAIKFNEKTIQTTFNHPVYIASKKISVIGKMV